MDSLAGDMSGSRIHPQSGVVQAKDNSFAWFETTSKHMPAKSEAAGVAIYEDVVVVKVQQPGDMNAVTREYRAGDERRWPDQWAAFQAGRAPKMDGTPLAILFPGSPAQVKNLESVGIHTIEQFASVTDGNLTNIPMGLDLRSKAKAFIEARDGAGGFNKLQAQIDQKNDEIRSLNMKMDEMGRQMATLAAQRESDPGNNVSVSPMNFTPEQLAQIAAMLPVPEKRGPGRPPHKTE